MSYPSKKRNLPYLFDWPPWALIKFLDLEKGRLFEAGRLLNFYHFEWVKYVYFATKHINADNKTRRSNKARFLWNTLKETPSSGKSILRIYSLKWVGWGWALIWVWLGGGGGGRLFEAGRLFEVGANSRLGAYSNKYDNRIFQDSSWRRSVEKLICNGARIIDVRQRSSVPYSAVELWKKKKEKKRNSLHV